MPNHGGRCRSVPSVLDFLVFAGRDAEKRTMDVLESFVTPLVPI
jgi:hypothetical protein